MEAGPVVGGCVGDVFESEGGGCGEDNGDVFLVETAQEH